MTAVKFKKRAGKIIGFIVSGHSGFAQAGEDIVCAAVTSAVRLCECTINDVIGAAAEVSVDTETAEIDITLSKKMSKDADEKCQVVLDGFRLHLLALEEEYPHFITVSEV